VLEASLAIGCVRFVPRLVEMSGSVVSSKESRHY